MKSLKLVDLFIKFFTSNKRIPFVLLLMFLYSFIKAQTIIDLSINSPINDNLSARGEFKYYKVTIGSGEHLFVLLEKATGWASRIDIKYGALPTDTDKDDTDGGTSDQSDQAVEIVTTQAGEYFIRVRAEAYDNGGDYTITAHTLSTLPSLSINTPVTGNIPRQYAERYYKVTVGTGEHLFVLLEKPTGWASQIDIKYGALPTTTDKDDTDGGTSDQSDQAVEILTTQAGEYFVRVRAEAYDNGGDYTITAHTLSTLPSLSIGTSTTGNIPRQYAERYYKVAVGTGEHLFVLLEKPTGWASRIDIKYGALPTTTDKDDTDGGTSDQSDQAVEITNTQAGEYFIRVRAEAYDNGGDYTITAHTLSTLPSLSINTPVTGNIPRQYAERYYKVTIGTGEHLFVLLEKPTGWASQIDIKYGALPTTTDKDDTDGGTSDQSDQAVEILTTQAGEYFIRVRAEAYDSGGNYTITAHTLSTLPSLSMGTPVSGTLSRQAGERYYWVFSTGNEKLIVNLDKETQWASRIDIKKDSLPGDSDYDDTDGGTGNKSNQSVLINPTVNTFYFIRVKAEAYDNGGNYSLIANASISVEGSPDIQYFYDELGRLIRVLYISGSEIIYTYDANGNRISMNVTSFSKLPGPISSPIPMHREVNVPVTTGFAWHSPGATLWDFYLWKAGGVKSVSPTIADLTVSTCSLPYLLDNGARYYWQIVAKNASGETIGSEWFFTTEGLGIISMKLRDVTDLSEEKTDSQLVKVEIETTPGEFLYIMLSENNDFANASWETVKQPIIFKLSSKNGEKTVYAKLADEYLNETDAVSDSILLTTNDNSQIISDTIPSEMSPNQTYKVSVILQNTGASIWPQGWDSYRLGAVGDSDPLGGNKRYPMPKDVYPVDNVTIEYYLTAPATIGTYTTDWRMVKEGEHWFGEKLVKQVTVKDGLKKNNSAYIIDYIPEEVPLKQPRLFIITFKNMGNATWTKTDLYKLGISGDRPQLGCPGRVELTNDVLPGEETTFNFWINPTQEGEYTITLRMLQENIEWFGELATKTIRVVKYTEIDNNIFELYE